MLKDKVVINSSELRNITQTLNTNDEMILNILNDIKAEMNKFQDPKNNIWEGNMSRIISESFDEFFNYSYQNLNDKLHRAEEFLIGVANSTEETDINLKKYIESSDLNDKL